MPTEAITDTTQAQELCRSLEIECLPGNVPNRVSPTSRARTNAVALIQKIINRHGEDHAWAVLYALTETENHKADLTSAMIGAISDLFCRFPEWRDRLGDFCEAMDIMDLTDLRQMARSGPGIDGKPPKQRMLLAAYLQLLLAPVMDPPAQEEMVG
jgi:hypothetical protein